MSGTGGGADPKKIYELAAAHHRQGQLGPAETLYRQVLAAEPRNVGAMLGLAQVLFQTGGAAASEAMLRNAAAAEPRSSLPHTNLGIVLAAQGKLDEAVAALRQALSLKPDAPEILMNLAGVLRDKRDFDGAVATYRRVIALRPDDAGAHYNLATALRDGGDLEGAIGSLRRVVALQPGVARGHFDLANLLYLARRFEESIGEYRRVIAIEPGDADAWNNLSVPLQETGRLDEAMEACRRAAALRPDSPETYYNMGRTLQDLRRDADAADAYRQALALRPGYVEALTNLGLTQMARGMADEAVATFRSAVEMRPGFSDAWVNLGVALKDAGRLEEAIEVGRRSLAAWPDLQEARYNLGVTYLLSGDLARGWPLHEVRRQIPRLRCNRDLPRPEWTGEPLAGRRVLLHAEQGFGDVIQFVRYAPLVGDRGGRVVVLCQPSLKRLLKGQAGIEQVVGEGEPLPPFDLHCPLMSLGNVFGTTLATIPAAVPYVAPATEVAARWRERIAGCPAGLKVGIAWAGNPAHANDRHRSVPAEVLAPLAKATDVRPVSLQKSAHPLAAPPGLPLIDFTSELADFADTAGLVANLDLVVCVDTAVAHLAGAMGKPVWLMVPFAPDWRWMLGRSDSPWYPTMRLFRQPRPGDWGGPVKQIVTELARLAPG